eukprot:gene6750-6453_t
MPLCRPAVDLPFACTVGAGSDSYTKLDSVPDVRPSIGMEPLFTLFKMAFVPGWLATNASRTVTHCCGITSPLKDSAPRFSSLTWRDNLARQLDWVCQVSKNQQSHFHQADRLLKFGLQHDHAHCPTCPNATNTELG